MIDNSNTPKTNETNTPKNNNTTHTTKTHQNTPQNNKIANIYIHDNAKPNKHTRQTNDNKHHKHKTTTQHIDNNTQ